MKNDSPRPLVETLWVDEDLTLRKYEDGDSPPLLLFAAVSTSPSSAIEARLRRSHAVGVDLDSSWAVIPRSLETRDGRLTVVLDHPRGDLLARQVARGRSLAEFLRLAVGIAASVRKMHEHRIVHKDIRPSNLFVDMESGEARLTGFGIASRLPPFEGAEPTPDRIEGSAAYTAPEQIGRLNRAVDRRSDLYAVGITLYELARGV